MDVVDTADAQRYRWGQGGDGWHLPRGGDLGVIRQRMPPGSAERRHLHRHARQFFYVPAGQAVLELDGRRHRPGAGQGLRVAPGCAHQMRNDSAQDLHFPLVSAPHSHGERKPPPAAAAALQEGQG